MKDYLSFIVIGVYTIVYVIVFIIQKQQRDNDREIIAKMESFMKIFDIKKIEDFVKVKEETIEMKYNLLLNNNEKLKKIANEIAQNKNNELIEMNKRDFGAKFHELVRFVLGVLMTIPKEERHVYLNSGLPIMKNVFLEMLQDIDNKKT